MSHLEKVTAIRQCRECLVIRHRGMQQYLGSQFRRLFMQRPRHRLSRSETAFNKFAIQFYVK